MTRCILNPETDFLRLNYVLEFRKNDENLDYISFGFGYYALPWRAKFVRLIRMNIVRK